jgi:hypothetical protein
MSKDKAISSAGNYLDAPPNYAEASNAPSRPMSESFQTTFACISLNMTDRIRLIRFPPKHVEQVEEVVRKAWPKGIQSTRVYGVSHEIKTKGNPWSGTTWDKEKVAARSLISDLLGELYSMGWLLKASVDMSKKDRDKGLVLVRSKLPP